MNQQLSQGYLESSSRKRPSPALVSDDDLGHRPEGHKVPKLIHHESRNNLANFQHESPYSVSSECQNLSDRGDSPISSPNAVLDINKDESAFFADTMTGVLHEKTDETCCFGMVG